MNVLSLFDGMSCGQIALNRANIKYNKYYASEIESGSIKATLKNYPNTIQLGDVTKIKSNDLEEIYLLIGGSPCQSFSLAGKRVGMSTMEDVDVTTLEQYLDLKHNGFSFKGQSYLFWEYVRLLNEIKPKYFLLENVKMISKWEDIITKTLGVEPIHINSSLLSGQDRKRLYWTNIPDIKQPDNKSIYFKDILDTNVDESLFLRKDISQRYIPNLNHIENIEKSSVIGKLSNYQGDRVFDVNGKSSSLSASGGNNGAGGCNIIFDNGRLRRISVNECEKLQTVPIGYLDVLPKTTAYKVLGNGWTVDVITHIFKYIK
jgi:DNA (cytosine-5)-methyltransferase 3A